LLACLAALALIGLLAGSSAAWRPSVAGPAVATAARQLASEMRSLQIEALTTGRSAGLIFPPAGRDEPLRYVVDGDGDGIHRDDVRSGRDPAGAPFTLARDHPGVVVGSAPWPEVPDTPPRSGTLGPDSPAVRFGSGRAAVFTARGRARAGSVLVTDRREGLCAVVVHGATGRIRVLCYDRASESWRPSSY
jgi:hypothetical protein